MYNYERQLYDALSQDEKDSLNQDLVKRVAEVEKEIEMNKMGTSDIIEENIALTTSNGGGSPAEYEKSKMRSE